MSNDYFDTQQKVIEALGIQKNTMPDIIEIDVSMRVNEPISVVFVRFMEDQSAATNYPLKETVHMQITPSGERHTKVEP